MIQRSHLRFDFLVGNGLKHILYGEVLYVPSVQEITVEQYLVCIKVLEQQSGILLLLLPE